MQETRRCALKVVMDGLPKTIDKDILEVWDALNNLWWVLDHIYLIS